MKTTSLLTLSLLASLTTAAPAWADSGAYDNALVQVDSDFHRTNTFHNSGSVYQPTPDTFSYSGALATHYSLTEPGLTTASVHVALPTYDYTVNNRKRVWSKLNTSWFDTLTINNAAYTGQTGMLNFDVRFDGDITWSGENSLLLMEDHFYVNGNEVLDPTGGISYGAGHNGLQDYYPGGTWSNHQTYTVSTSFIYGQAISLGEDTVFWSVNTNYISQSGGFATYDGTFTSSWAGNLLVTAPDSSSDTSFTPASSSGTDYSMPVAAPEPGSLAMLVIGLAPFALLRRRAKLATA